MAPSDIAKILKDRYPEYLSYQQIIDAGIGISRRSVFRCLEKMQEREEIEFIIRQGTKKKSTWETLYRIKL